MQCFFYALFPVPGVEGFDLRLEGVQVQAVRARQIQIADGNDRAQALAGCGEHIRIHIEQRLLGHVGDPEVLLQLQGAVVRLFQTAQYLEHGRLASAIAADQTNALGFKKREVRMIEQRDVTERELGVEECDECHVARIIGGGTRQSRARGRRALYI
jgi:hypothetical protein